MYVRKSKELVLTRRDNQAHDREPRTPRHWSAQSTKEGKQTQGNEEVPVDAILGNMFGVLDALDHNDADCTENEERERLPGISKQLCAHWLEAMAWRAKQWQCTDDAQGKDKGTDA